MNTQPEALRLADAIDPFVRPYAPDHLTSKVAADELRRLHSENIAAVSSFFSADNERIKLRAQRDELLEALRALVCNEGLDAYFYLDKGIGTTTAAGQRWLNARAVIAAAEEEKTKHLRKAPAKELAHA